MGNADEAEGKEVSGGDRPIFDDRFGVEKGIGKAKKGIGSKEFTRGSQEMRNRAPCGCTVPSCDLTCPWERFRMKSAQIRATTRSPRVTARVQSQSWILNQHWERRHGVSPQGLTKVRGLREKIRMKKRKKRRIRRRTPLRKRCLLLPMLWTWMPTRTTYSTLRRHPEYSPIHSSQAFAQNPFDDAWSPSSHARSQPSFDLSSIWPPPIGPSQ
ncbi:hypothetical protein PIB30_093076 [Stylosanthes scabra]|uniref:Uncharacterized protein n=1 Tax=Stylosanthes scabra TaxID=79078 RepID=A0ABU6UXE9_9FABA|nr:hypothetical protein [Stylosanthes scabra]